MYNKEFKGDVCSHSHSFFLDNFFRKILQNPKKIVGEYISKGDTVIDLGCGPGFFSIEMAKMVGDTGKIYSVDLQKEMLDDVKTKAMKQNLTGQIILHKCDQDKIGLSEEIQADFILAFYMVHETPDPISFAKQVKPLLKKGGKFLIVEPLFHVSKKKFLTICQDMKSLGFSVLDKPKKKGGRSLLLTVQD
jgi:ubiquinone/menaquinone biosynthesis C-methylase UbiE